MSDNILETCVLDPVNHPQHYTTHPSGVETIDITRNLQFNLGNAWKYLMRFRYKGKPMEDLKKAVWYLNDFVKNQSNDKYYMSIEQSVHFAGKIFNPNLNQNKITADMIKVIKSESDFYVRLAFILIATIATFGNSQFLDAEQVINKLDSHRWDILEDTRNAETNETAAHIIEDLEKEDRKKAIAKQK